MRRPAGVRPFRSGESCSCEANPRHRPRLLRIPSIGGTTIARDRGPNKAPAATFTLLAHDLPGKERERGRSEETEADPPLGQLVESPSVVQPAAGNCAHLVVELGPTGPSTVIAEADECGCLGGGGLLSGPP